ncbi:MAG: hypothetical protein Q9210_003713 [Variospora velana]
MPVLWHSASGRVGVCANVQAPQCIYFSWDEGNKELPIDRLQPPSSLRRQQHDQKYLRYHVYQNLDSGYSSCQESNYFMITRHNPPQVNG